MPSLRLELGGAVFHIVARGNQGQKIFADDHDREMWLATLAQAWRRTGWRIHAWALMANHYHLLLEAPEPSLVRGMKTRVSQAVSWAESSPAPAVRQMKKKLAEYGL